MLLILQRFSRDLAILTESPLSTGPKSLNVLQIFRSFFTLWVSARLGSHRNDARFKAARAKGTLCVAFASVAAADQEGVEKYLATRLPPVVGERHPESVREIAVNSPFAA